MKKISIIILIIICVLVCGCEKKKTNKIIINGEPVNTSKMEHKHCTRSGTATGADVKLEYDIYYTNDRLNILKSSEKVISSSNDILDTYENAYKSIHSNYVGLLYYDTEVTRGDTSVLSTITIDYDHVDIDRLIEIEGEEDNIFENKVPKVDKWIALAKKLGASCELVEE